MENNNSSGVNFMCEFELPSSDIDFAGYIDYIDREEVKEFEENDFSGYIEYMDSSSRKKDIDKEKVKLFSNSKDIINKEEKELIKNSYRNSQEKGGILWKGVFSFETEWLKEKEIVNEKGQLNEALMIESVRKSMGTFIEKEKFNNAIWLGEIHYNTEHFHVHTSLVEADPRRKRGKIKQSSINKTKSKMAFSLSDRSKEFEKINQLIRENIVHNKKDIDTFKNKEMKKRFIEIMRYLPADKRQWQYGYNSLNHIKPKLNELSKFYINNYCEKDFQELNIKLDKEVNNFRRIYGEGKEGKEKNKYKDYKENQIESLYKRMGNTFLTEMKEYAKIEEKKLIALEKNKTMEVKKSIIITKSTVEKVKRGFNNDIQHMKNKQTYNKLQNELEVNKNYENEM